MLEKIEKHGITECKNMPMQPGHAEPMIACLRSHGAKNI
jgi:hypothetical protein